MENGTIGELRELDEIASRLFRLFLLSLSGKLHPVSFMRVSESRLALFMGYFCISSEKERSLRKFLLFSYLVTFHSDSFFIFYFY